MEPSGRNPWQPVANPGLRKPTKTSCVASLPGRLSEARLRVRGGRRRKVLRIGGEPREPGALRRFVEGAERSPLQVVIEKRDRGAFDDAELRFRIGVRGGRCDAPSSLWGRCGNPVLTLRGCIRGSVRRADLDARHGLVAAT